MNMVEIIGVKKKNSSSFLKNRKTFIFYLTFIIVTTIIKELKNAKRYCKKKKKIIENYQLFVNSLEEIEKFCLLSFQNPDTPFDYYYYSIIDYELPKVNTIEELYQYVRVVQVYISSECYEVRLQFLYSPMDTIIHGHLNDNSKSEMGIKLANDLIGVNTIIETE